MPSYEQPSAAARISSEVAVGKIKSFQNRACLDPLYVLREVNPSHVFFRWHKEFAFYGRDDFKHLMQHFKERQRDERLLISKAEYDRIVAFVEEESRGLPSDFWIPRGPVQTTQTGLVTRNHEGWGWRQCYSDPKRTH